jgi:hypothetical protein
MVSSGVMAVWELPSYSELAFLGQTPPLLLQTRRPEGPHPRSSKEVVWGSQALSDLEKALDHQSGFYGTVSIFKV